MIRIDGNFRETATAMLVFFFFFSFWCSPFSFLATFCFGLYVSAQCEGFFFCGCIMCFCVLVLIFHFGVFSPQ